MQLRFLKVKTLFNNAFNNPLTMELKISQDGWGLWRMHVLLQSDSVQRVTCNLKLNQPPANPDTHYVTLYEHDILTLKMLSVNFDV